MPVSQSKSLFLSKTFWVNAAAALTWLAAQSWVAENPKLAAAAGVALAVVNIGLRIITDKPVNVPGV